MTEKEAFSLLQLCERYTKTKAVPCGCWSGIMFLLSGVTWCRRCRKPSPASLLSSAQNSPIDNSSLLPVPPPRSPLFAPQTQSPLCRSSLWSARVAPSRNTPQRTTWRRKSFNCWSKEHLARKRNKRQTRMAAADPNSSLAVLAGAYAAPEVRRMQV